MGIKEAYLKEIEQYLGQFWLDLERLKVKVEKKNVGNDAVWLIDFHALQQKGKHLVHLVQDMRKHTDGKSRHAGKIHIESAHKELMRLMHHASHKFLQTHHPHPEW